MPTPGTASHQQVNPALREQMRVEFQPGLRPIQEYVLTAPVASVTFANIPGNYRNVIAFLSIRSTVVALADNLYVRCNADAAANYDWMRHFCVCGGAVTFDCLNATNQMIGPIFEGSTAGANYYAAASLVFHEYKRVDRFKRMAMLGSNYTVSFPVLYTGIGGQWQSLNPITSLTFFLGSGNLAANSTITLYGVL